MQQFGRTMATKGMISFDFSSKSTSISSPFYLALASGCSMTTFTGGNLYIYIVIFKRRKTFLIICDIILSRARFYVCCGQNFYQDVDEDPERSIPFSFYSATFLIFSGVISSFSCFFVCAYLAGKREEIKEKASTF